jgi:2-deoxy-D-gluconate 3-dehydrogenase
MILDAFRLDGKNALVTGSGRGLGARIALALAEAGANVAVHARSGTSQETFQKVRALGRQSAFLIADLADFHSAPDLIERAEAELGPLDILVNNAGIIRRAPAVDYSEEDWTAVLAVNLSSVFRLSQAVGKRMVSRNRGGKIVNLASLLTFQGGVFVPAYAAAKGGVGQLTKALANEWAPHGINVNAIAPGYMETDVTTALRNDPVRNRQILERIPAGRWGEPSDLAGAAVFLCSPASNYVNGHLLAVDGGWLAR